MPKIPIALCKLQGVNVELLMANARGQGPIAKCKLQCAIAKCQGQIANCKGPRARNFTQEGPTPIKNIPTLEKIKASIVRVSSSNHELRWFWCKFPLANARGPRARGQLQITNCEVPGAKGQRHIARGQGQGISEKIHKNRVKPYQIQSKTKDLDSQVFGFQS